VTLAKALKSNGGDMAIWVRGTRIVYRVRRNADGWYTLLIDGLPRCSCLSRRDVTTVLQRYGVTARDTSWL
jgi:hypothetical protein